MLTEPVSPQLAPLARTSYALFMTGIRNSSSIHLLEVGPDKGNLKKVDNATCGIWTYDLGIKRHVLNRCATIRQLFLEVYKFRDTCEAIIQPRFLFWPFEAFSKKFCCRLGWVKSSKLKDLNYLSQAISPDSSLVHFYLFYFLSLLPQATERSLDQLFATTWCW